MTTGTDLRERIARKLSANPRLKTAMLAETLAVPEAEIMRSMPAGFARELDPARSEQLIRALAELGTLYIVCRNPVAVMEVRGRFGGFSQSGPFFNVSGENLHMHLRLDRIHSIFAVQTSEGADGMSSFQFFDDQGTAALKAFILPALAESDGASLQERLKTWTRLRDEFSLGAAGE
jgi:putative hemin transport protein